MSDFDETDVFWESRTPEKKKKKKKDSKREKKCRKHKNNTAAATTEENIVQRKKRKKNSKFKDAMEVRKEKKRGKKKNGAAAELGDGRVLAQSGGALTPDKKSRRKKNVAFDLSRGVAVRRPQCGPSAGGPGGRGRTPPRPESQEDANSQDLFITQKTFRASPPSSDGAPPPRPRGFTPPGRGGGALSPPSSDGAPPPRPRGFTPRGREEDERFGKARRGPKDGKRFEANVAEEEAASRPAVPPRPSVGSTSTQTENFFTAELSSFLDFRRAAARPEAPRPLDLSLPRRARSDPGRAWPSPGEVGGAPRRRSDAAAGDDPWSEGTDGKREATQSLESEPEPKSTDTTTSGEDETPCRSGKLDLTQVRAVQMRLNESFFFKTKGEARSPRPESPLMKLVQGRELKHRKGR